MGVIQDMYLNDIHKGREALSKAKGILKKARGQNPRDSIRGYHKGTRRGRRTRRPGFLWPLRLRDTAGSLTMKTASEGYFFVLAYAVRGVLRRGVPYAKTPRGLLPIHSSLLRCVFPSVPLSRGFQYSSTDQGTARDCLTRPDVVSMAHDATFQVSSVAHVRSRK
jgi:hypothetical protein